MMATISTDAELVTLINVFTVDPARQDELLDVLVEATKQVVRNQPGFISANFHKSLDGTHVANYAQWRTAADMQAMLASPEAAEHLRRASEIATEVQPVLYQVAYVAERD